MAVLGNCLVEDAGRPGDQGPGGGRRCVPTPTFFHGSECKFVACDALWPGADEKAADTVCAGRHRSFALFGAAVVLVTMIIINEELEGFDTDDEDELSLAPLSLRSSRTDLWDDEDERLSQCPTTEVC